MNSIYSKSSREKFHAPPNQSRNFSPRIENWFGRARVLSAFFLLFEKHKKWKRISAGGNFLELKYFLYESCMRASSGNVANNFSVKHTSPPFIYHKIHLPTKRKLWKNEILSRKYELCYLDSRTLKSNSLTSDVTRNTNAVCIFIPNNSRLAVYSHLEGNHAFRTTRDRSAPLPLKLVLNRWV